MAEVLSLLTLSVSSLDGSLEQFVLRPDEPLSQLTKLFCYVRRVRPEDCLFTVRGREVRPECTAAANGLTSGDVIQCSAATAEAEGPLRRAPPRRKASPMSARCLAAMKELGEDTEIAPGVKVGEFVRMDRAQLHALVNQGEVALHADGAPESPRQAKTARLRRTYTVAALIWRLWLILPKAKSGCINRDIYHWFCRKLFFRMEPEDVGAFCNKEQRFEQYFEEDWAADSQGQREMGFAAFYNAMYRFADMWSDGHGPAHFAQVLLFTIDTTELALAEDGAQVVASLLGRFGNDDTPGSPGISPTMRPQVVSPRSRWGSHAAGGSSTWNLLASAATRPQSAPAEPQSFVCKRQAGAELIKAELRSAEQRRARDQATAVRAWQQRQNLAVHDEGFFERRQEQDKRLRGLLESQLAAEAARAAEKVREGESKWMKAVGRGAPLIEHLRRRADVRRDAARRAQRQVRTKMRFDQLLAAEQERVLATATPNSPTLKAGPANGWEAQLEVEQLFMHTPVPGVPIRATMLMRPATAEPRPPVVEHPQVEPVAARSRNVLSAAVQPFGQSALLAAAGPARPSSAPPPAAPPPPSLTPLPSPVHRNEATSSSGSSSLWRFAVQRIAAVHFRDGAESSPRGENQAPTTGRQSAQPPSPDGERAPLVIPGLPSGLNARAAHRRGEQLRSRRQQQQQGNAEASLLMATLPASAPSSHRTPSSRRAFAPALSPRGVLLRGSAAAAAVLAGVAAAAAAAAGSGEWQQLGSPRESTTPRWPPSLWLAGDDHSEEEEVPPAGLEVVAPSPRQPTSAGPRGTTQQRTLTGLRPAPSFQDWEEGSQVSGGSPFMETLGLDCSASALTVNSEEVRRQQRQAARELELKRLRRQILGGVYRPPRKAPPERAAVLLRRVRQPGVAMYRHIVRRQRRGAPVLPPAAALPASVAMEAHESIGGAAPTGGGAGPTAGGAGPTAGRGAEPTGGGAEPTAGGAEGCAAALGGPAAAVAAPAEDVREVQAAAAVAAAAAAAAGWAANLVAEQDAPASNSDSDSSVGEQEVPVIVRASRWSADERWCRCLRPTWGVAQSADSRARPSSAATAPSTATADSSKASSGGRRCTTCGRTCAPFLLPARPVTNVSVVASTGARTQALSQESQQLSDLCAPPPPAPPAPTSGRGEPSARMELCRQVQRLLHSDFLCEAKAMHSRFACNFPSDYVPTRAAKLRADTARRGTQRCISKAARTAGDQAARPLWHVARLPPTATSSEAAAAAVAAAGAERSDSESEAAEEEEEEDGAARALSPRIAGTAAHLRAALGQRMLRTEACRAAAPQSLDFVAWIAKDHALATGGGPPVPVCKARASPADKFRQAYGAAERNVPAPEFRTFPPVVPTPAGAPPEPLPPWRVKAAARLRHRRQQLWQRKACANRPQTFAMTY